MESPNIPLVDNSAVTYGQPHVDRSTSALADFSLHLLLTLREEKVRLGAQMWKADLCSSAHSFSLATTAHFSSALSRPVWLWCWITSANLRGAHVWDPQNTLNKSNLNSGGIFTVKFKDPVLYLCLCLGLRQAVEGLHFQKHSDSANNSKQITNVPSVYGVSGIICFFFLLDLRITHHPRFSTTPSCYQPRTICCLVWLFHHFFFRSISIPFHKCLFLAFTINPGLPLRHQCRKAQACTRSFQLQQVHIRLNPAGRWKYRSKSKLACTAAKGLWVTACNRQWGEPGGAQTHTLHRVLENPAVAQRTVNPSFSFFLTGLRVLHVSESSDMFPRGWQRGQRLSA